MVSEAIARGDVAALNYFVAEKYIKAFARARPLANQKILMLPIEATSVLGSLGGIAEIARADVRRRRPQARHAAAAPDRPGRPPGYVSRWAPVPEGGATMWISSLRSASGTGSSSAHPAGARAAGARHLHAVARALGHPGRADLACHRLALAGAGGHFRGAVDRARPGLAALRAPCRGAGDRPFLNRRAEGFVGRIFMLDKPIVDGSGTIRLDDTIWRVTGPDVPAGSRVKVAHADGASLLVELTT